VNDIIMPPVGLLLGGVDFSALVVHLKDAAIDAKGQPIPPVDIRYGVFLNAIIAFVVIAFVVWRISKMFIKEEAPAPAAPTKTCPYCKEANAVDATKCKYCASSI
jgi:large conductance mechanosensitive channel